MQTKADGTIVLSWSAPARPLDAGDAIRSVHNQHQHIRVLLQRAMATAEATLDGDSPRPQTAAVIEELRATMEGHLTYEERVLLPLLRSDPPLGPQRAENLLAEHRHQRQMLAAIHHEAQLYPRLATLSAKLSFLARWLLADMEEEERSLLSPEVVREDIVVVDQTCS